MSSEKTGGEGRNRLHHPRRHLHTGREAGTDVPVGAEGGQTSESSGSPWAWARGGAYERRSPSHKSRMAETEKPKNMSTCGRRFCLRIVVSVSSTGSVSYTTAGGTLVNKKFSS